MRLCSAWRDAGPIGLLAGSGELPLLFAEAARSAGRDVIVFGVRDCTDPRIEAFVKETHYVSLGSVGELIGLLKAARVRSAVLAGGIPKERLYDPALKLDGTARGLLGATANHGDDHLLKALAALLKLRCGISVIDSRRILKDVTAPRGALTRRLPTAGERADIAFGLRVARGIGRLDIGQTVAVKDRVVVAVEAIEGTDAAIRRAGQLAGVGVIIVKTAKPRQDLRFDLPCVGPATIDAMAASGARALGVEAGKTILLEKDRTLKAADEKGISITGV